MKSNNTLNKEAFGHVMTSLGVFPKGITLAIAVSGGADSTCLAMFMQTWATNNHVNIVALVVDHKIREESTKEAESVKKYLEDHNIQTVILTRSCIELKTRVQETARKDRHKLLIDYCVDNGIPYLCTAHHSDDQLETYVFRKNKGDSLVGHAGMSAKVVNEKIIYLRPLLTFTKNQIIQVLQGMGKKWVEDPSNTDTKYSRVVVRLYLKQISESEKGYLKTELENYIIQRISLEENIIKFFLNSIELDNLGLLKINKADFLMQNNSVKSMVLRIIIRFIGDTYYYINLTQTSQLLKDILYNKRKVFSVGKCIIQLTKVAIVVFKEDRHINDSIINVNNRIVWDNRFVIDESLLQEGAVGKFNPNLIKKGKKCYILPEYNNYITVFRRFLSAFPAVYNKERPLVCYNRNKWRIHYCSQRSLFSNIFRV